jgi:hypothetical protein
VPRGPAGDQGRPCWFSRGVAGIGLASFLSDVGHEVPTSLLPSFLTSTIKAPASALGLIEGISDAPAGIARFGGGALADNPQCHVLQRERLFRADAALADEADGVFYGE